MTVGRLFLGALLTFPKGAAQQLGFITQGLA
jgi:hypothetical protein